MAGECQNARAISFTRAITQLWIHKHRLFLGKASYNETRYYYCQIIMNHWNISLFNRMVSTDRIWSFFHLVSSKPMTGLNKIFSFLVASQALSVLLTQFLLLSLCTTPFYPQSCLSFFLSLLSLSFHLYFPFALFPSWVI